MARLVTVLRAELSELRRSPRKRSVDSQTVLTVEQLREQDALLREVERSKAVANKQLAEVALDAEQAAIDAQVIQAYEEASHGAEWEMRIQPHFFKEKPRLDIGLKQHRVLRLLFISIFSDMAIAWQRITPRNRTKEIIRCTSYPANSLAGGNGLLSVPPHGGLAPYALSFIVDFLVIQGNTCIMALLSFEFICAFFRL